MSRSTPERDWKYIRSVHDDLLATLRERINQQSAALLASFDGTEHEKYLRLYRHIQDSDEIIALCFNALKRSNLIIKLAALQHHGILTPKHIENLSQETQEKLQALKQVEQKQLGWDIKRNLARINYRIHTDAVKANLTPPGLTARETNLLYA